MASNRFLNPNDIQALFNDENFWNDDVETKSAEPPIPAFDKITTQADESDQEEVDNESESSHDSQSEVSCNSDDDPEPSNNEQFEGHSEDHETDIDQEDSSDSGDRNQLRQARNWHGKDRTVWAKQHPVRRKTTADNIIRFLPGLAGYAQQNPPSNAIEAWSLLISDEMLQSIVEWTNQKISTMAVSYTMTKKLRPSFICETNLSEIKAFLGLLYLQGIFKSNHEDLRSMWSTDGTGRDIFNCTMTLARFYFLLSCLRFDDQTTRPERREISKLAPIQELFEEFVSRSTNSYTPGAYLTIDEMLVPFRGRCPFRMYIPNKPAKYGIKVQILADAKTHYMCKAEVYLGKTTVKQPKNNFPHPTQVVNRLVSHLPLQSNRNITADNWYSSIETVKELQKRNLTYVGTMKKNKRQIPPEFQPNRRRQEFSSLFGFQGNVTLVSYVPKRGKAVVLISSMHHDSYVNPESKKPEIIEFYNKTKSGVDALDQKCAAYSTSRRTRRWPMAIFHCILNIAGVNSRVLFQFSPNGHEISRFSFLKQLGMALCKPHMEMRMNNKRIPRHLREGIARKLGTSLPIETVPEEEVSRSKRKRCAFCPPKKDRKCSLACKQCKKPLCMTCAIKICPNCSEK